MLKKSLRILSLFILIEISAPAHALERTRPLLFTDGELSWLTGLEYQQADYGTTDSTGLWRIPLGVGYRLNSFSFFASMPLLFASSDGIVHVTNKTSSSTSTNLSPTSRSGKNNVSGIGDVTLSGTFYLTPDFHRAISYHLTAAVKLGTADENQGLGTGENDFFLEGGVQKNIDGFVLAATLGYEISGDAPDFEYENALYGTVSFAIPMSMKRQLGASLFFSQAQLQGTEAPLELTVFYQQAVNKSYSVYYFIANGLSDGSPDYSLGGNVQFYY